MKKVVKIISKTLVGVMLVSSLDIYANPPDSTNTYFVKNGLLGELLVEDVGEVVIAPKDIKILSQNEQVERLKASKSHEYGQETIRLDENAEMEFIIDVPKAGGYHLQLDYYLPKETPQNLSLNIEINGEMPFKESNNIELSGVWKDSVEKYLEDDFGNELYPRPMRIFRWQSAVLNSSMYQFVTPFIFEFKEGPNTVKIKTNQVEMLLGEIRLLGKQKHGTYEDYEKSVAEEEVAKDQFIVIEGEKYLEKSESYIRGSKSTNYNATPYHPTQNKINELSESMWADPGEAVTYEIDVPKDGIYYIGIKYRQREKEDMPVFKNIKIDNEVLFEELNAYSFDYTKGPYKNHVLSVNDKPMGIYLKEGKHTLSLESTADPYYETYENLLGVINQINDIALQIKVITGNKTDKNREWGIEEYIPTLTEDLLACAQVIDEEYEKLGALAGRNNVALIANLKVASDKLRVFSGDLDYLVNNLDQFSQGSSSVAEYVSLILPELIAEPMAIEKLYITGDLKEIPEPNVGFVKSAGEEIKKLALSFVTQYDNSESTDAKKLDVWVNRPVTHIEVLREKVAAEFEKETGIEVNISAMPDEQKLLLAVSAGREPDVVLGASSYRPFDFALRGAVYDLRQFEDFGEVIESFNPEMFIPFTIGDACYGLPETANFMALFYRKDILNHLQLDVPETWEEVISILPTLARYDMNFNTPIANVGGMKHFGTTIPFIQQYEGRVYAEDGSAVEFGDPKTVEAFKLMTDLYTRYSLPESIPNFYNNFKKGITPIGMSDMNTYILLQESAPEIAGQWGIAPSIGIKDETGYIHNYQPAVNTASIIMADTTQPDEAWELIKWWMSDETQMTYATDLQLRYGPEYVWNTANLSALGKSTAFPQEDREVILNQLNNTKEIPRNPAYFSVERELSNAWNKVVFEGVAPRTALDQAIITSNREIAKKLKEFGYMGSDNTLIKPFELPTKEKIESWKE